MKPPVQCDERERLRDRVAGRDRSGAGVCPLAGFNRAQILYPAA
jgi:hypothetical protein